MTYDREHLISLIAHMLDRPSAYMGGPSRHNLRKAGEIVRFLYEEGLLVETTE